MMKTLKDQATRIEFRKAVAEIAVTSVGTHEQPAGSNLNPYGAWYGLNGYAWCAMFVSWVYAHAAERVGCENPLQGFSSDKGFSGTVGGWSKAVKNGWVIPAKEPLFKGDIIVWKHSSITGHTGIITYVNPDGSFDVTEGNTSAVDHSSRNGGEVATHHHSRTDGRHDAVLGVFRPTRKFTTK